MISRAVVVLAFVLGACGASEAASTDSATPSTPVPTVPGVGSLPDTVPTPEVAAVAGAAPVDEVEDVDETVPSVEITRPVDDDGAVLDTIAEQVQGNRLIVVGDSILASTSTRYGGELCAGLNPLGWTVEVDAEPGRFVEFGNEVLTDRLSDDLPPEEDFDAAIVHLGSNYDRDRQVYFDQLNEILFRLAPRPTVLMTVTEYKPEWAEVNAVIEELAALYDNVTLVDWGKVATYPGVLSGDGLHPGQQGEAVLVDLLGVTLGEVDDEPGECLSSPFTDDSAVGRGSGPSLGPPPSVSSSSDDSSSQSDSSSSESSSSSSGGSWSGDSSSGGSSGGWTPQETSPPPAQTSPPPAQTSPPPPPQTSPPPPPQTSPPPPPQTSPPATSPPAGGGSGGAAAESSS